MYLNKDIHQTGSKIALFLCKISLWNFMEHIDILFLFERASKTAVTVEARFFIMSLDIRKKFIERSMSQKSGIFSDICPFLY
jgi:hypothetical protein